MARGRLFACFRKGSSATSDARDLQSTSPAPAEIVVEGGGPVVVELFSSQGCTTSPEAELLVSRLGRGDFDGELGHVPVIVLAYHVDYWDHMGWKDPFGSSQWTVRQKAYVEAFQMDTLFTPQVVVQGRAHCVGNDDVKLIETIRAAPRFTAPKFQATFQRPTSEVLEVSLTGALRTKVDSQGANIMVALYENGKVTDCPRGDNKGRVLSNDFIVRKLQKLCAVKDLPAKKTVSGTVSFPLWDDFNSTKCGVALFVENNSHQIFGSQSFHLPDEI